MLDRVHRQARPRADIDIAMVQRMDAFVEERYMEQPVDPIEMERGPDWQKHQSRNEQNRV